MAKYVTPADVGISDNRAAHIARGSAEPGTDYMTPYGTDLRMPGDGVVSYVEYGPAAPGGRRLRITCGDEWIDLIHLDSVSARVGDLVRMGQTGVCRSGASGYGSDRYYGPHVHVTRRRVGAPYRDTLNFEDVAGPPETPASIPPAPHLNHKEYPDMFYAINKKTGAWFLIVPQGNAKPRAVILGANAVKGGDLPVIEFEWDASIDGLMGAVDGFIR